MVTGTGTAQSSLQPPGAPHSAKTLPCTICFTESCCEASFDDIRLFRCPKCRHCFTDLASLRAPERYGAEYFDETHKNWNKHPDVTLFERVYRALAGKRPNASVLDVGCGKGNLLRYLRDRDSSLKLSGIDIAPNQSTDGIEFLQGDFLSWKFDSKFDVVVSLQVIEHVTDPRMFTKRIVQLVAEDGLVISNTINEQSLLYEVSRLARRLGSSRAYERLYSRHHLNHFNTSSLPRLLEGAGLRTEKRFGHGAPLAAMDIPAPNKFVELIFRVGVWGTFVVGGITGSSPYQTVISRK